MVQTLSKKERTKRLIRLRNLEHLYGAAKKTIKKLEKENKGLKTSVLTLSEIIEKFKLQIEELRTMVFGKKKKDKNKDKDKDDKGGGLGKFLSKFRKPSSYRRSTPKEEEITEGKDHPIKSCLSCKTKLTKTKTVVRYTEDIKLKSLKTTLKQNIETGYCPKCQKRVSAKEIPKAVVSLGENTRQLVAYSNVVLRLSYQQTRHLIKELANIKISDGEIANILKEQAGRLRPYCHKLTNRIRSQPAAHYDETGYAVQSAEQGKWAWVMAGSETEETVFLLGQSRGKGNAEKLKGGNNNQVGLSDDYGAYRKLFKHHQLCWAHLLRKLRDLKNSDQLSDKKKQYAKSAYDSCNTIFQDLKAELEKPYNPKQREKTRQMMAKRLERLAQPGKLDCFKLKTIKKSLIKNKDKYLTALLFKETIPLTNNKAERALRHLVLKRKSSFGSKTQKGAETMSVLYSVLLSLWWSKPDNFFEEYRRLAYGE